MTFGNTLKALRSKTGKSRYRLAQFTGIDQAYLFRLEGGERDHPSQDLVINLGLALVSGSDALALEHIEELLLSAGYTPLRNRIGALSGGSSP